MKTNPKEINEAMMAAEKGEIRKAAELLEIAAAEITAAGEDPEQHPDIQFLVGVLSVSALATNIEKTHPEMTDEFLQKLDGSKKPLQFD